MVGGLAGGAPSVRHDALLASLSCHRLLRKVADLLFEGFPIWPNNPLSRLPKPPPRR
jgi:hypothetical protein